MGASMVKGKVLDIEKEALQKAAIDNARKRLAMMDLEFTDATFPDIPNVEYLIENAKSIISGLQKAFID
jgi:hypothetical protein